VETLTDTLSAGTGGMDVDARGRIYMADFGRTLQGRPLGTRVLRIAADGDVEVWAEGLAGASGNAFDASGRLLQSSIGADRIDRIGSDGVVEPWVTGGLRAPVGVAIGPGDTAYVANCGDHTVRRVTPEGRPSIVSDSDLLRCPNGIARAGDGNLYVSNFANGDVVRIAPDGSASRFVTIPGENNGHLLWGNGVLYVVGRGANRIYEVTLEGRVTPLAGTGERGLRDGPALQATLSLPNDVALSPDGAVLYFNDVAATTGAPDVIAPVVVRALVLRETGGTGVEDGRRARWRR
jgi:sugar lactone lactonase YvrE